MSKEPWWKKELKEILAISSTFFVLFVLFMLMKKAVLAQYELNFSVIGTAIVGALIIGKVVLIFDKLPLTRRFDYLAKIYGVLFRSIVYLAGYVIFTLLEHIIKGLIAGESLATAVKHAAVHLATLNFVTSLISLFVAFLFFNTFWIIRNHYGPGELYRLFFKRKK